MLTVMSFNIRQACDTGTEAWEVRRTPLVTLIKDIDPDLIGFQEVLHNQLLDLVAAFPEFHFVGVGRNDGVDEGERAAIFYKKYRFIYLDSGNMWLSETPDIPSFGWDAECIRICTHVKLLDRETGQTFIHFNTHLDHNGQKAVYEGAKQICDAIHKCGTPAFVTGDFNVVERSAPYNVMIQNGLSDAKYSAKSSMSYGTFHGYGLYNPGEGVSQKSPIDYVFFMESAFDVESYEVVVNGSKGKYSSDHYPVLVKMTQIT